MSALDPPLALVTGGHRRLGARIAMRLAKAGYALAIHGRLDAEPHPFLADTLRRTGTKWRGFVADFLLPGEVEALIPAVSDHFDRAPDLLVNSAAIFGQDRLEIIGADDLAAHFMVNASAPVLLTQAFARSGAGEAVEGAGRSVVNIVDQRLAQPHGDQLAYTLSKFALDGFTSIAARELAPNIRVNAVAPGLTLATEDYTPEQLERLAETMPLGHLPQAEAVADAVLYLAQAQSVTGETIRVDAGAHMRSHKRDFMHLA